MVNPFKEVNWNPGLREKRRFALSLIIGCPALALALLIMGRLGHGSWRLQGPTVIASIGVCIGSFLWIVPSLALPCYRAVYFIACCIGIVVSNVLLIIFFYGILTPIGLLLRLCGRVPIQKGLAPQVKSYWKEIDRKTPVTQYYRQF